MAMQTFLVEKNGNAEAGVLDEEFLDGVGQLGHLARRSAQPRGGRWRASVAGTANLSEPQSFREGSTRLGWIKIAFGINEYLRLFLPDAHHLRGFFLQRHVREQIGDAPAHRNLGLLVKRNSHVFYTMSFRGVFYHKPDWGTILSSL
jgi:hypothetical protein